MGCVCQEAASDDSSGGLLPQIMTFLNTLKTPTDTLNGMCMYTYFLTTEIRTPH